MQISAQQISALVGGTIEGDANATVNRLDKIEEAQPGSFCFLGNLKYEDYIYNTKASIVLVSNIWQPTQTVTPTLIRVPDVYSAFAVLLDYYQKMTSGQGKVGLEQPSFIAPSSNIGKDVYIAAFCYVAEHAIIGDGAQLHAGCYIGEGANIGKGCILHAGVKVYHQCKVGAQVIIHAGTVIGSDGFGFAPQEDGSYKKVPQTGNVVIEDFVEIGANCTIDRATMGSTIIRSGVKLDNLIQIAHNVEIGENTVIAAQSGISGSTKIGKGCVLGGQVGTVGHITIADGTKINGQSGIGRSIIETNTAVTGSPAFDYKSAIKSQIVYKNLPELQQKVVELQQQLEELMAAQK